MRSVLVAGADGVLGSEIVRTLRTAGDLTVVGTTRRGDTGPDRVRWRIGAEPVPEPLRRHWDVVVHAAASTRWTMTRAEATAANIDTTSAMLDIADRDTHFVHVSTAYVGGERTEADLVSDDFDGYRNGYEWSKARCEELVLARYEAVTVVRPPLILGRRADGAMSRFSGPYTLLQALVSGLAAVVVGDPAGRAEIAPVDDVADCVAAAVGRSPDTPTIEVLSGGDRCLRLSELLTIACTTINEWRAIRDIPPIQPPPILATARWRRFFLPLARQELSEVQNTAVDLLGMFEGYTSMAAPFEPTWPVADPATVLRRSVRYWAEHKPRLAGRIPESWAIVPATR